MPYSRWSKRTILIHKARSSLAMVRACVRCVCVCVCVLPYIRHKLKSSKLKNIPVGL